MNVGDTAMTTLGEDEFNKIETAVLDQVPIHIPHSYEKKNNSKSMFCVQLSVKCCWPV